MSSPTARSKAWLEKRGWLVHITEKWNHITKRRIDAFGFADLVAFGPGGAAMLVQVTTGTHLAARVEKARALPVFHKLLAGGHEVQFHGWRKVGPRGKRKLWQLRRIMYGPDNKDMVIDDGTV